MKYISYSVYCVLVLFFVLHAILYRFAIGSVEGIYVWCGDKIEYILQGLFLRIENLVMENIAKVESL